MRSYAMKLWINIALLIGMLAIALPLSGLIGLRDGMWFPVRWVSVSGPLQRVSAEQVRASVAPLLSGGLLRVNPQKVRQTIEALPWVERAEVRKEWPGTLTVRLTERLALARWGTDQLITTEGKQLELSTAQALGDMPQLSGPQGRQQDLIAFYRAAEQALGDNRIGIVAAHFSDGGGLTVTLDDGTSVLLGSNDFLDRWTRFLGALPQLRETAAGRNLERVDLRYSHGLAVRWRDVQSESAPAIAGSTSGSPPVVGSFVGQSSGATPRRTPELAL
jgi:cell division protein FtsQ